MVSIRIWLRRPVAWVVLVSVALLLGLLALGAVRTLETARRDAYHRGLSDGIQKATQTNPAGPAADCGGAAPFDRRLL